MNVISDGTAEGTIIYQYTPLAPSAYVFIAVFGMTTIAHFVLLCYHRTPFKYFFWMILGGIMEAGGYYGRAWSSSDPKNFKAYILYILLTLAAPPFIAATIYITLARIITTLDAKKHSIFSPRWLTVCFINVDNVTFLTQMAGAGMQASISASMQATGRKVVIGGLVFQILCFAVFVLAAYIFHRRNAKMPGCISQEPGVHWRRHFWVLYSASLFILVRNIFRIAEYTGDHDGFIAHNEAMIYVFDATLMWLIMLLYVVVHPGMLVRQVKSARMKEPAHDGQGLAGASNMQETTFQPWA